jgi:hypothetical protein
MICTRTDNGTFAVEGLSLRDLELIQEALHEAFNESKNEEHRWYCTWVVEIDRAIDPVIDKEHQKYRAI